MVGTSRIITFLLFISQTLAIFVNSTEVSNDIDSEVVDYIYPIVIKDVDNHTRVHTLNTGAEITTMDFANEKELIDSPFWDRVMQGKDVNVANSYTIYLEDTGTILLFGDSERIPDKEKRNWPFKSPKKQQKKQRDVEMIAVQPGQAYRYRVNNIAVSPCISTEHSSSGASYTQSYRWSKSLSLSLGLKLSTEIRSLVSYAVGASIKGSFTLSSTGSITCNLEPFSKVQVFGNLGYAYYPDIRHKGVTYNDRSFKLHLDGWKKLINTKPSLRNYGAVLLDLASPPTYSCIDDISRMQCDPKEYYDQNIDDPGEPLANEGPLR